MKFVANMYNQPIHFFLEKKTKLASPVPMAHKLTTKRKKQDLKPTPGRITRTSKSPTPQPRSPVHHQPRATSIIDNRHRQQQQQQQLPPTPLSPATAATNTTTITENVEIQNLRDQLKAAEAQLEKINREHQAPLAQSTRENIASHEQFPSLTPKQWTMQQQPMQQQYMQQQQPMTQHYPAYALPPPFPGYMQTQDSFEYRLQNERLRALLLQKDKEIQHLKEKEYLRYGGYGDV